MPRNTNQQASRNMRYLSKAYEAVSDTFKSGTQARLRAEIDAGMQLWQQVCPTLFLNSSL